MSAAAAIQIATSELTRHRAGLPVRNPNVRVMDFKHPLITFPMWRVSVGSFWHVFFLHGGQYVSATAAPIIGPPVGPNLAAYARR
jgi:hypothetical protein